MRALLLCTLLVALQSLAFGFAPQAAEAQPLPEGAAAAFDGTTIGFAELDRVLVDRHALSEEGKGILRHLVHLAVLEAIAAEKGLEITDAELNAKMAEIGREMQAMGQTEGLLAYLRRNEVDPDEFRETLRMGLVHERLTREALGIPDGDPVSAESQQVWLEQELAERGLVEYPPPFADGMAAECGSVRIPAEEYIRSLRTGLDSVLVREACYQLLLGKIIRESLPPFETPEEIEARIESAVANELKRRRDETAANPAYKGITHDALLQAQGVRLETWHLDPAVRVAALATVHVDMMFGEEGLREEYEYDKTSYEDRFGAAVRARMILLRASIRPDDQTPRSFDDAQAELARLGGELANEAAFAQAAARMSEDGPTRESGGNLGWVTRGDTRVFEEVREALFVGAGVGRIPEGGRSAGPVRLPEGVALFWIADRRDSPDWSVMKKHVHRELRRKLVEKTLPLDALVTFLDSPH